MAFLAFPSIQSFNHSIIPSFLPSFIIIPTIFLPYCTFYTVNTNRKETKTKLNGKA